MISILTY